ncbi:MAG: hypothetical protein IPP46_06660 [Bacteroidetes bacterium]|nr:hypothetical protein [Bacteroidota bacterium]
MKNLLMAIQMEIETQVNLNQKKAKAKTQIKITTEEICNEVFSLNGTGRHMTTPFFYA